MSKDLDRAFDEALNPQQRKYGGSVGLSTTRINADRAGYLWVRLLDNPNEAIRAYNQKVPPIYDLPVEVIFKNNRWEIIGVDDTRYSDWKTNSGLLAPHGASHSAMSDAGGGGDVVWVDTRQFLPFLVMPSGSSGSHNLVVGQSIYRNLDGEFVIAGNTGTPTYPSTSPQVMYILMMRDEDGYLYNLTGSQVPSASLTGTSQLLPYLPQIPLGVTDHPLAGVRAGTGSLGWGNLIDLREFFSRSQPNSITGMIGDVVTSPGPGIVTGTIANDAVTTDKINVLDFLRFNVLYAGNGEPVGTIRWNAEEGVPEAVLDDDVTLQVGLEMYVNAINNTGSIIPEGFGVGFTGSLGNSGQLTCGPYLAAGQPATYFMGVTTHEIAIGALGKITYFGKVRHLDTTGALYGESGWADGEIIWSSGTTAGYLTKVRPTKPAKGIQVAAVVHAHTNGTLMVRPTFFSDLNELNDVETDTATEGSPLTLDGDGIWRGSPIHVDTQDPTGWITPGGIWVGYDISTRKITLTGTLSYYWQGIKRSLTSPWESDAHDAADGEYFLYTTDGTSFAWSTSPWAFYQLMVAKASKSTSPAYQFGLRETHGLMPWQVHQELHEQISCYRESGGSLTVGTYAENTATDVATTPGFDAAAIRDEDLPSTVAAWTQGAYTTLRIGASSKATFDTTASFPFRNAPAGYIYINNPITGAETEAATNRYLNVYQILVPTAADTDSQKYRMLLLQPQASYTSLAAALAEDTRQLLLGDLATTSPEFVFYARITYVTSAGDGNTGKCRIATGGVTYIAGSRQAQVSVGGFAPPNAENVPFTPTGDIVAINVQAAIAELDTEKVAKATFDANTILKADLDNTPTTLTIPESTLVGRLAGGVISALTVAEVKSLQGISGLGTSITPGKTITIAGVDNYTLTVPATGQALVSAVGATVVGSIPFYSTTSGVLTSDSTNLFWDDTNDRLGLGANASLAARLHVQGATNGITSIFRAPATGTANITEWQASGGTVLGGVSYSGHLGIGVSPVASTLLYAQKTLDGTTTQYGTRINTFYAPTSNETNTAYGLYFSGRLQSNFNHGAIYGVFGLAALQDGSGILSDAVGVSGAISLFTTSSGSITRGYSFIANGPTREAASTATIGTLYGMLIQNQGASYVGTSYGLMINSQSGSSASYSIYTNAGSIVLNAAGDSLTDFTLKSDTYDAIYVDASNDSAVIMSNALGKIGVFGATAVARQAELTDEVTTITHTAPGTPDYVIQTLVSGGYGFVTADEGHSVLAALANAQTRINELEARLVAYGWLPDAD